MNMKFTPLFLRVLCLSVLAVIAPSLAVAAGEVDTDFNPGANGRVFAIAEQTDGKTIIGGAFTNFGGATRNYMARLNADDTLDAGFNPNLDDTVYSVAVQPDGKILIGGEFATVGGAAHVRVARLHADGTPDATFNADVGGGTFPVVYSLALQSDGKIVVGGNFTRVNGVGGRNRIARLNADGTLDTIFNPDANFTVRTTVLQADGKILVGGDFAVVGGVDRNRIARLNADGTLDTAFNPGANSQVNGAAQQADGKVILWGEFTSIGTVARSSIARVAADGALEAAFAPAPNSHVRSVSIQADGKILIGGEFTTVGPNTRNRVARLNADGTLDTTFSPSANNIVYSTSLQEDGKILLGGSFTSVSSQPRNSIVRLSNDPATETLSVPVTSRVEWLRGGSSPEVTQVTFELSADAGATWSLLGSGTRKAGGWELTGQSLSSSAIIRARGHTFGGHYNSSSGFVETVLGLSPTAEIAVEQPLGTNLVDGDATPIGFGTILTGATATPATRIFTIRNSGLLDLTGLAVTIDGDHAGDYSVTPVAPTTLGTGGSTEFTVTFTPTAGGSKSATLHIASNDSNESPFDIKLDGRALDPVLDDDGDGMSNAAEVFLAASGFDPVVSSTALITQLKASGVLLKSDVQTLALTEPVLERDADLSFSLSISVEQSVNLVEWLPVPVPEPVVIKFTPVAPAPLFYRVLGKKP